MDGRLRHVHRFQVSTVCSSQEHAPDVSPLHCCWVTAGGGCCWSSWWVRSGVWIRTYARTPSSTYILSIPRDESQAPIHASSHLVHCGCVTSRAWCCLLPLLGGMVVAMCNRVLAVLAARSIRYLFVRISSCNDTVRQYGHFAS